MMDIFEYYTDLDFDYADPDAVAMIWMKRHPTVTTLRSEQADGGHRAAAHGVRIPFFTSGFE